MRLVSDILRSRVLPAIVAALGVSFIAAGLLTYTTGTDADLFPFPSNGVALGPADSAAPGATDAPNASASAAPADSPAPPGSFQSSDSPPPGASSSAVPSASGSFDVLPTDLASDLPLGTTSPSGAAAPTAKPSVKPTPRPTATPRTTGGRVATRVVIPALEIDLPVVRPPGGSTTYPLCNVAMYIQTLSQPGYPGATYIYAHARIGMFLPLLDQSRINNGAGMIGMLVQVYTSDNQYFIYQISDVRRHQLTLADAIAARDQELWLQTSEGPHGTPGKLQVIATPLSSGPASPADAHPTPHPVVCG